MHVVRDVYSKNMERLMFEWSMVTCGTKNGHQRDMCLKEIRLRVQNMLTIQSVIVNMISGIYLAP